MFRLDDYIDADVAYLAGLILARGVLEQAPERRLILRFPFSNLKTTGISTSFDQETAIRLGIQDIRERLSELLATDVRQVNLTSSIDLVFRFPRSSMAWRNILLLFDNATSFPHFQVPAVLFDPQLPYDYKLQFVRGYGDAAGNIRKANTYVDGRFRVRLDVLNYPTNWKVPVQICTLLQEHVGIPVHLITWGHPNLNRDFREHQINIFADSYLKVGFSFNHKQKVLEELATANLTIRPGVNPAECPGKRAIRKRKPKSPEEQNSSKLPVELRGRHFNSYWQICKALGCKRLPPPSKQKDLEFVEEP